MEFSKFPIEFEHNSVNVRQCDDVCKLIELSSLSCSSSNCKQIYLQNGGRHSAGMPTIYARKHFLTHVSRIIMADVSSAILLLLAREYKQFTLIFAYSFPIGSGTHCSATARPIYHFHFLFLKRNVAKGLPYLYVFACVFVCVCLVRVQICGVYCIASVIVKCLNRNCVKYRQVVQVAYTIYSTTIYGRFIFSHTLLLWIVAVIADSHCSRG